MIKLPLLQIFRIVHIVGYQAQIDDDNAVCEPERLIVQPLLLALLLPTVSDRLVNRCENPETVKFIKFNFNFLKFIKFIKSSYKKKDQNMRILKIMSIYF